MKVHYGVTDPTGAGGARSGRRLLRPIFLLATVSVLGIALVALFLPRDVSHAADPKFGVQWNPTEVDYWLAVDNFCYAQAAGRVDVDTYPASKQSPQERATLIQDTLRNLPAYDPAGDDYGVVTVQSPEPVRSNFVRVAGKVKMDCKLMEQAAADSGQSRAPASLPRTSLSNVRAGTAMGPNVRAAAVPKWAKGALAIVAGSAVYLAVSIAVTAAVVAVGAEVVAGGAALTLQAAAIAAISGCVGGAAADTVLLFTAEASSDWKSILGDLAAGCITGAAIALLPIATTGEYIGAAIRGLFTSADTAVAAVGGTELAEVVAADTSMAPLTSAIPEILTTVSDAAVAVR